jgi:hypothetical protein
MAKRRQPLIAWLFFRGSFDFNLLTNSQSTDGRGCLQICSLLCMSDEELLYDPFEQLIIAA